MPDRATTSLWMLLLGGSAAAAYAAYLRRRRSRSKLATRAATFEDNATFSVAVVDFEEDGAARKFTDSLKKTGFAVLTNHPVPSELITGVYDEW